MSKIQLNSYTTLLVIDIQERLISAMAESESERVIHHTETLIELGSVMGADIRYTEQYPKGLGRTVPALRDALGDAPKFEKTTFDACDDPGFSAEMSKLRPTVIVTGMETHICVQSTVTSLIAAGHRVIVPFDAVLSRSHVYKANGLEWMKRHGAEVTNVETLVFQTLVDAKSDHFKRFSKRIQ